MNVQQRRYLGIVGLVFIGLFIVSGSIVSEKSTNTSADQLAAFYAHHRGGLSVEAHVTGLAVFVGIGFFWFLRELLATTPTGRRLATMGFAGAILFAAGGSLSAGLTATISAVATHASPQTIQTLHVMLAAMEDTFTAGGIAVFLVATGVAITRGSTLPRWLGWVGVVLGVAALVVPELSGLIAAVWSLITSIVLLVVRTVPEPA